MILKIEISEEDQAAYVRVSEGEIKYTKVSGEALIDYDAKGNVVGIEFLNVGRVVVENIDDTPSPD